MVLTGGAVASREGGGGPAGLRGSQPALLEITQRNAVMVRYPRAPKGAIELRFHAIPNHAMECVQTRLLQGLNTHTTP